MFSVFKIGIRGLYYFNDRTEVWFSVFMIILRGVQCFHDRAEGCLVLY